MQAYKPLPIMTDMLHGLKLGGTVEIVDATTSIKRLLLRDQLNSARTFYFIKWLH